MRIPPYFNVYWLDSLPPSSEYRGTIPIMSNRRKRFRFRLVPNGTNPRFGQGSDGYDHVVVAASRHIQQVAVQKLC